MGRSERHASFAFALAVSLALSISLLGQETKPLEPELLSVVYRLDEATKSLKLLERQMAPGQFKLRALGFGGAKAKFNVDGEKSPFRIGADDKQEFVIKMGTSGPLPEQAPSLFKAEPKKGKREVLLSSVGGYGIGGKGSVPGILCDLAKYGDSLKIVPAQPLPPGEYCFYNYTQAFCFGVDSPVQK